MSASIFSAHWYRVADLRPQLGEHVEVRRQLQRGETWHLLLDRRSGRSVRLNAGAYAFVGRLNGRRSVAQAWDELAAEADDRAPTQDEAIRILLSLQERELLRNEPGADFDALRERSSERAAKRRRRRLNPLALRIDFGAPRRLLAALEPLGAWLFRRRILLAWCVCVCAALTAAAAHWTALAAHAAKWMGTPHYALLALACYPIVKLVHELAHGLAVRRFGGEVPSMGITLLVFMPVPFVDASASAGFRHARQRIAVSAAGIMAELALASIALALWLALEPGIVRDLAFVVAFIGAISTVAFNANPLLRFDGYYVLVDALGLPNLAARSGAWWLDLVRRRLLGAAERDPLPAAPGERKWLALYAPLSFAYRTFLCIALAGWAGTHSYVLGAALGSVLALCLFYAPAAAVLRQICLPGLAAGDRWRALAGAGGAALALVALLAVIPAPFGTVAQGVVWLPEEARLRAETDGFVERMRARDGDPIVAGEVVLELRNPALLAERERHRAGVSTLEAELHHAVAADPAQAAAVTAALDRSRADLALVEARIEALTVRAQSDGVLVMPRQDDLEGSFARRGTLLAHVLPAGPAVIRVAIPQEEAALVSARARAVAVRLAERLDAALPGELVRDSVAAESTLPSAALAARHGGSFLTDPDDKDALRPLAPVVVMEVRVPDHERKHVGERAWVRFDYGAAPLAEQWLRRLRQGLLKHFNPAS